MNLHIIVQADLFKNTAFLLTNLNALCVDTKSDIYHKIMQHKTTYNY